MSDWAGHPIRWIYNNMQNHTLKMDLGTDRHLIVGDLHGRYDQLIQLLELANYDPAKDIVYSVGDMIDRGEKSIECVEFFQQERCYAVQGNHELMMRDDEWMNVWLSNGGLECLTQILDRGMTHAAFKEEVAKFPWVIDVGEDDEEHAFRIVHAEMPPGWDETYFQRMLDTAIDHNDISFSRLLWSRKLITAAASNVVACRPPHWEIPFHPNRHRNVFTGHTPCNKAFKCGDHFFLDTWSGHHQTMIDAVTKETWTVDIAWTPG